MPSRTWITAAGIFLIVLAVYGLASPGRIDMIDGQYRFEVSKNIVEDWSVQIRDPFLTAAPGLIGAYSAYGISGSIVALPLVVLSRLTAADASLDRQQFFFAFTSPIFGAATIALLFVFYRYLEIGLRAALGWTFVAAFATLTFVTSTTVFDQGQHAFFVLAATLLALAGGRRGSIGLCVAAGALLAFLENFQETYAIFLPTIAIASLGNVGHTPEERRRAIERAVTVMVIGALGLVFWAGFNNFRFGSFVYSGKGIHHPPALGNPAVGFVGLLFSPGKSVFLYSPTVFIALVGFPALLRRHTILAISVAATCLIHLALISTVTFYGGDWCWGPRYFATTLPLMALAYPFAIMKTGVQRITMRSIVIAGLCVQLLGLSLDLHRFFYARSLSAFFWYFDRTLYFRDSALFSRPGEIIESIRHGVPPEVETFRPGPYSRLLTYAIFGGWGHPELPVPQWMRHYAVFWLPRPWPLWMLAIEPDRRPVDMVAAEAVFLTIGAAGLVMMSIGRRRTDQTA